jgi:hypothetical protein
MIATEVMDVGTYMRLKTMMITFVLLTAVIAAGIFLI